MQNDLLTRLCFICCIVETKNEWIPTFLSLSGEFWSGDHFIQRLKLSDTKKAWPPWRVVLYIMHNFCFLLPAWSSHYTLLVGIDTAVEYWNKSISLNCCEDRTHGDIDSLSSLQSQEWFWSQEFSRVPGTMTQLIAFSDWTVERDDLTSDSYESPQP